ncbi:beta-ketoacyl synthase N-terminal-like domain-containing protein [Amycolatopsis palatopharyngis]|uniref:beta-ketoacyl synthase N-terminal-like domain-containing protein n=1 Tax=Amycolatopsis palatopharyngis TaxID=187982 RepID=UPI000E233FB0|nr:beta-ketoacyl synthase N-terminal-like domain-containing protein [Amycolatopsis palatopharyngis]
MTGAGPVPAWGTRDSPDSTRFVDTGRRRLLLSGWSLHLPDVDARSTLAPVLGPPGGQWARTEWVGADSAATVLGRKGLLYKEPATRLALCAVHRALGLPWGQRGETSLSPETAVIACSSLGNVGTVAKVARTIAAEGGRAVSVLDAPNVSSNVMASSVALWFGFGGPNLQVCSGSAAGFSGLRLAELLLRSERASRVVLVGAEPADEVAAALHGGGLRAGSACVVLERAPENVGSRGHRDPLIAPVRAVLDLGVRPGLRGCRVSAGGREFDIGSEWGDFHGAHGVVALSLAAHLAVDEGHGVVGIGSASVRSAEHVAGEKGFR